MPVQTHYARVMDRHDRLRALVEGTESALGPQMPPRPRPSDTRPKHEKPPPSGGLREIGAPGFEPGTSRSQSAPRKASAEAF
jgi:hypothetical protein